jgi:TolB-like protein/tetratricopeptide (TPR) repeat protein
MGENEDRAFEMLKHNHTIHIGLIKKYHGALIKEVGDGTLASFPLASDAVRCAIEIQQEANDQAIPLKIGIHEGEIVMAGEDVLGDGVNIASRLQELSGTGCITISGKVYSDIKNKPGITTKFVGDKKLKNVTDPVKVYEVLCEEEKKASGSEEVKSKSKVIYYLLSGLVIILAALLLWQLLSAKRTSGTGPEGQLTRMEKSIAVLPFRNDSPDEANEYFCNGMVETILTSLQKIGDLRVKSRTSIEQYRNPDKDLTAIARELKVAFILEGSVQKAGDNIRVTAQLIEGSTGDHLWAEIYDGKYTEEIFSFQTDVAKRVASSLQAVITPEEIQKMDRRTTTQIMAWDLLWRGMGLLGNYQRSGDRMFLNSAHRIFEKAIAVDPNYPSAYYGKGHAYSLEGKYDSALYYAEKIFDIDPEDPYGYFLMGEVYNMMGNKPDLAFDNFEKAVELGLKEPWGYLMLGIKYCSDKNDYKTGLHLVEKSLESTASEQHAIYASIGRLFLMIGEYALAEKYFKNAIDLHVGCYGFDFYLWPLLVQGRLTYLQRFIDSVCVNTSCQECSRSKFWIHITRKEFVKAENSFQELSNNFMFNVSDNVAIAYLYLETGRAAKANDILDAMLAKNSRLSQNHNAWGFFSISAIYTILNDKKMALKYLSKAVDSGLTQFYIDYIMVNPIFEDLRDDPEFRALLEQARRDQESNRAQVRQMLENGEVDL